MPLNIALASLNPTSNKSRIETGIEEKDGSVTGLSESDFQQIKD